MGTVSERMSSHQMNFIPLVVLIVVCCGTTSKKNSKKSPVSAVADVCSPFECFVCEI